MTGMKYVVTSKCCQNHFISEKYRIVQSFKLRYLQNISLVQLYNFASDCWFVGNIPGSHFVQAFSVLPSYFYDVSNITKASFFQCSFHSREHIKFRWSQVSRVRGMLQYCHNFFFPAKSLTKTNRCTGALSWRRNSLSPFFGEIAFWPHHQGDKWCQCIFLSYVYGTVHHLYSWVKRKTKLMPLI